MDLSDENLIVIFGEQLLLCMAKGYDLSKAGMRALTGVCTVEKVKCKHFSDENTIYLLTQPGKLDPYPVKDALRSTGIKARVALCVYLVEEESSEQLGTDKERD